MSDRPLVVVVGGSGVFGRLLAEGLAVQQQYRIVIAGRTEKRAALVVDACLSADPQCEVRFVRFDRNNPDREQLAAIKPFVVIDAAGPFQNGNMAMIDAAIDARVHYVDIADSRVFVAGIAAFDAAAKHAGVAVISGASSTPALSHAVLDEITASWQRIDTIKVAIFPGNRAPLGRSLIEAILSWTGRPVRVFHDGHWQALPGWTIGQRIAVGTGRSRHAALAETADLDLLVSRYNPTVSALFFAGLQSRVLHYGTWVAGWFVRLNLMRSLNPLAGFFQKLSQPFRQFGSDTGYMVVEANGMDPIGMPAKAVWRLEALNGRGPYVPTFAALTVVDKLAKSKLIPPGAMPCTGLLRLADLEPHFIRHGIKTDIAVRPAAIAAPFRDALGADFERLPNVTRRLHGGHAAIVAMGSADVDGAENGFGRIVARVFRLPVSGARVSLVLVSESVAGREHWTRVFSGMIMRSRIRSLGAGSRMIEERFGLLRFAIRLDADATGLSFVVTRGRLGRVPLPAVLLPQVTARESVSLDGFHAFDVSIGFPLVGLLARYRGKLQIPQNNTTVVPAASAH